MKQRGEVWRVLETGREVGGERTEVRRGPTPLEVRGEASGTGLTGRLVNWIPAGMVRISFPCWTLRIGLPPRRRLPKGERNGE